MSPPYELKFWSERSIFIDKAGPRREARSFYVERFAFLLVFANLFLVARGGDIREVVSHIGVGESRVTGH